MRNLTAFSLRVFTLFLLFLVCSNKPAFSQEEYYDLFELVELGLERSIPHETAVLQNKNIHSSLISSYLDFLPSLSVSTSRHFSNDETKSAGFSLSKSISLNEPTYFNWRRARIDWQSAGLALEESRKETAFEVFSRYLRVLESKQRVDIQSNNLEVQEKIFDQIELLYEQQQRSLIDLKQSEISLINAQIALENAGIQYENARENLFHYLNITDEGYDLREPDIEINEDDYEYKKPIELLQAEKILEKSTVSLLQTKLDFLPSLSLSYIYNYRYPGDHVTDDLFDFTKYDDSYTISLTASYSLLTPLEHRQVFNRSRRNLRIQEKQYEYQTTNTEKRFEQLIREWTNEQRVYKLVERRYDLAVDNLEMAQERFNLGIMSLLELDQATSDYLEAELELNSRYYQLLIKQEEINLFLSRRILDRW